MTDRASKGLALALIVALGPLEAQGGDPPAGPPKVVLVETFGPAPLAPSELPARPGFEGPGGDRVASIRFPVDPDHRPEGDPSALAASGRRLRAYLASTDPGAGDRLPLVVVDGRPATPGVVVTPSSEAIRRAQEGPAGVALDLHLDGLGLRKTCSVKVAARSAEAAGRDVLVGLALSEAPASGDLGDQVVRRFEGQVVRLGRAGSRTLVFSVALEPGSDPSRARLTAFAQDRADGRVHQAEVLPWTRSHEHPSTAARRSPRRAPSRPAFGPSALDFYFAAMSAQGQGQGSAAAGNSADDGSIPCIDCGSPFIPPPAPPIFLRHGQSIQIPATVSC